MAHMATGKARVSLPQSWVDIPDRGYLELHYPNRSEFAAADAKINTKVDNITNGNTKVPNALATEVVDGVKNKSGNTLLTTTTAQIVKNDAVIYPVLNSWVRVAEITDSRINGDNILLMIGISYGSIRSGAICFSISYGGFHVITVNQISSTIGITSTFDKIRVTRTKDYRVYVELHSIANNYRTPTIKVFGASVINFKGVPDKEEGFEYSEFPISTAEMAVNGVPVATTDSTVKKATRATFDKDGFQNIGQYSYGNKGASLKTVDLRTIGLPEGQYLINFTYLYGNYQAYNLGILSALTSSGVLIFSYSEISSKQITISITQEGKLTSSGFGCIRFLSLGYNHLVKDSQTLDTFNYGIKETI